MEKMEQFRGEIDQIDGEMAQLFCRRMDVVKQIGLYKAEHGLPITDPVREAKVLARTVDTPDTVLNGMYGEFHHSVVELSKRYQKRLRSTEKALPLDLHDGSCEIIMERGCLCRANELLDLSRRVFIVTDDGVPPEYAQTVASACAAPRIFTVAQGEGCKSLQTLSSLLDAMLDHRMTRQDCVVAVGGGAVCDLAGFAASVFARGIDHYNVPTTLLAQVDASVGGKTGINFGGIKNAVGTFCQPEIVLIDPLVLETLPERQMISGLAEALKIGVTLDPELFTLFERKDPLDHLDEIIRCAVTQKTRVVSLDERENGLRRVLNFGHTIGHAIEMTCPELLHGECVALGMLAMCSESLYQRLLPIYKKLHLPIVCSIKPRDAAELIAHDKKRAGADVLAVEVSDIGQYTIRPIAVDELTGRISRITKGGIAT